MTPSPHPAEAQERENFERDAQPMGFDLTRFECAAPEPWAEYADSDTGHRWGGWLARASHAPAAASGETVDYDKLEKLGWQRVVCGACGSDMARARPKANPAAGAEQVGVEPFGWFLRRRDGSESFTRTKPSSLTMFTCCFPLFDEPNEWPATSECDAEDEHASMRAQTGNPAATSEWNRGWNACLDALDAQREQSEKRSWEGGK